MLPLAAAVTVDQVRARGERGFEVRKRSRSVDGEAVTHFDLLRGVVQQFVAALVEGAGPKPDVALAAAIEGARQRAGATLPESLHVARLKSTREGDERASRTQRRFLHHNGICLVGAISDGRHVAIL